MNNAYTISSRGNRIRRFPSRTYSKLKNKINVQLESQIDLLEKFNNYYDIDKHYLTVDWIFYYPIFTKSKKNKRVSKVSGDTSNIIKVSEDILFSKLDADDSQVVSVSSTKVDSKEVKTKVIINIKELSNII